jgi:hypothetical protein
MKLYDSGQGLELKYDLIYYFSNYNSIRDQSLALHLDLASSIFNCKYFLPRRKSFERAPFSIVYNFVP